ncbi:MAG: methyltransferase domain-containing protein [Pseudomonadota bacterium]
MTSDSTRSASSLFALYDASFYDEQVRGSAASAAYFLQHLFKLHRPSSVLDVGCGRGTWLKVCGELGAPDLYGIDGPWNHQDKMLDQRIKFSAMDLNAPLTAPYKVDLAMSLEVAEHLKPETAQSFVAFLSSVSDVVLFGAAFPGQGGVNHINEHYPSYWGESFSNNGFDVFDMFRPKFWSLEAVEPWYRQNTFLYVRRGNPLSSSLAQCGIRPMENIAFMDCVLPRLYEQNATQTFTQHLNDLLPSLSRALRTRLGPRLRQRKS